MTAHAPAYPSKRSHGGSVFIILLLLMIAALNSSAVTEKMQIKG